MAAADYNNVVQQLYVAYFGRPADPIGLMNFTNSLNNINAPTTIGELTAAYGTNATIKSLIDSFGTSTESANLYTGSTAAFVNAIFLNVLGRSPALEGLLFWSNAIDSGALTRGNAAAAIMAGAQTNTTTQGLVDAQVVANKTQVAINFTAALDTAAEVVAYSGAAAASTARTMLSTVSSTTDVTAFQTNVTSAINTITDNAAVTGGSTFTLTTGADTGTAFTGTTGNDTFVATVGTNGLAANGTTLNAGDVLDGGAGTDTLNISISGTNTGGVGTTAVTLSNIENISVSNFQTDDAQDNTISLAQASGIQKISLSSSAATGDTLFTSVRSIVTAEMGNGAGDLSITYTDAAVAGTADTQTLNLKGQTAGEFVVAAATTGGVETIAINSATSANTVKVTSSTATAITVSGDQDLTLTEGMTNTLTSVNASSLTGKLTFTHNEATAINIVGGSANDSITFSADNFTSADSVDGGAGTDTLSIATTVAAASTLANVKNVEVLRMTGGADLTLAAAVGMSTFTTADVTAGGQSSDITLNTGYTGATTVNLGQQGKVVNSANVALTVNATAANLLAGDDITVTGGSGNDTLNITTSAAEDIVFASRITGVEFVNVVDKGDDATGTKAKGADIKLSLGNYATNLTVDASSLDAGTVTNGVMGADDETLYVDGASVATATVVLNVTGGAGADTLIGGAGNDILSGGAGNDSIDGSVGGNDNINGGAGDDTINMGSALTSADTIDGGEGNDTLIVTNLSSSALANVKNIETLAFNGSASLTSNLSFSTIDLTNGTSADTLAFATGYTTATTVRLDAGDTVSNAANIALTVEFNSDDAVTVTGGTGTDTLNITASTSTVATSGKITGVEVINVVDYGDDAATGTKPAGEDITIDLTSYATALKIDASALDAGTLATNGSMNADWENLTITGTSAKRLTVIGGSGADTIVGSSDADAGDNLSGGAGNDTFTMANNLTYQDTIDGGAGTDTITTGTTAVADVAFMNVTNVEKLTLAHTSGTATLGSYFNTAAIGTVNYAATAAAVITATGATNGITFEGTAGGIDTSIVGGQGNDTFKFNNTDTLTAADSINGGAGTDTIVVSNAAASVSATVDFDNVTNVERVALGTASGSSATTAQTVSLTIDTLSATTAQTITIDGSVITDSNDTITVTNNAGSSTTKFSITGGAGADTLAGSNGADTIVGGDGNDSITGGRGADALTGGSGSDTFAFAVNASSASTGDSRNAAADTISDFVSGTDKVSISFTATGTKAVNATYLGAFASNTEALGALSNKEGEYFFNTTTKQIVMDVDGNGLIQADDLAITLTGVDAIAAGDVVVSISGATTVTGTAGDDTIDITAGVNASVDGGAGNDTFLATQATLDTSDSIVGGTGTDTLRIGGAGTVTLTTDARLATVENIVLAGSGGLTVNLTGQTEIFNITMSDNGDSVTLNSAVAHTITGGTGADTVTLTRAALAAVATVAGGSGADKIVLSDAGAVADSALARLASIETIELAAGTNSLELAANATTAGIVTVNASALTDGQVLTLTGSKAGVTVNLVDGDLTASAYTAGLTVVATTGTNVITTGSGNDTITGGAGADTITVGAGNDVIVLNQTASFDTIADFKVAGTDVIHLSKAAYAALGALGTLSAGEYFEAAGGAATGAGQRIILDTSNGDLFYDADGSGGGAAVKIASLTGVSTLANTDFVIVA